MKSKLVIVADCFTGIGCVIALAGWEENKLLKMESLFETGKNII